MTCTSIRITLVMATHKRTHSHRWRHASRLGRNVRSVISEKSQAPPNTAEFARFCPSFLRSFKLTFDVFLIRFEDGLDPVPPVTQRLFFFLVFLITVIGVFLGGEFGAWRAVSPDRGWTVQTVGLECGVCVGVCAAARAALQLRDVVVHRGVHGVVGLGDGRGATWWKERKIDRFYLYNYISILGGRLVETDVI